jgi:V/A-type H+-transporting ATPase subunit B
MVRLYAESKRARERQGMGFKLSHWDQKLLNYAGLFEERMMNLRVNYSLEEALDLGWKTFAECFKPEEVGMKQTLIDKFWPTKIG